MCTVGNYVYYVLLDIFLTESVMNKESKKTSSKGHENNGFFNLIGTKIHLPF